MDQTHKCSKCGEEKPWSKYQLYKGHPIGQCRECKTAAMKQKREQDGIQVRVMSLTEDGKKLCLKCNEMKLFEEFSPAPRGLMGLSAYCKPCHADTYRNKEKAVSATKRYRERHRERHLANHRVRMYEYNHRKKVTSDGSVTDEVLRGLYDSANCHYCGCETPVSSRTVDHKMPLARGGGHTASNLVMACFSCNSAKRSLTEEEFLKKRKEITDDSSKGN